MIAVVDRIVQYPHRYQLRNVATGEILGTFDLDPVLGTVQVGGTKINKELFDSIAADINKKVSLNGGELKDTIVTFDEYSGSANIVSGEKASIMMAKIKKKLNDHDGFIATKGKPNGFASLDGSGKVNETAKKAIADGDGNNIKEHYATKKEINESMKVVKDCKDEVGITGYKGCSEGLAFESAKSVFELPMINGQTGRASENLLNEKKLLPAGYISKQEDGSFKTSSLSSYGGFNFNTQWDGSKNIAYKGFFLNKGINYLSFDVKLNSGNACYFNKIFVVGKNKNYLCSAIKIDKIESSNYIRKTYKFELDEAQEIGFTFQVSGEANTTVLQLRNFMISKNENDEYQEFNDNLVNSHCVVKTTGVNYFSGTNWIKGEAYALEGYSFTNPDFNRCDDFIRIKPNENYCYKQDVPINKLFINEYDENKNLIIRESLAKNRNGYFSFKINASYIRVAVQEAGGSELPTKCMLNTGTTPQPYQPYTEDVIADIGELGFNDSIDNVAKKKYVGTSKVLKMGNFTLDGYTDEYAYFTANNLGIVPKWKGKLVFNNELSKIDNIYINKVKNLVMEYKAGTFSSREDFESYISDIQFNCELETITEIDMSNNPLPFTMRIEKGGMELQEPIGNALPYNLTKIYSVNKAAQIDSNSSANARQNEEISALESRASSLETTTTSLENNKADTSYVDEELGKKQPSGDYATKTELTEGLAKKQDSGDYQPAGDYATATALTEGLATKLGYTETAADSSKLGGTAAGDYALKTDIPTDNNQLTNGAGYLTKHQDISGKQDKEDNLLETTDKTVVGAINELNTNKANTTDIPTVPTKVSELENDSGFVTDISGKQDSTDNSLETTAKTVAGAINELNTNKANASTTLGGYGITDAKIENGTITLGDNSITPITDVSDKLGTTDTAADSKKLGGIAASEYAKTTEVYHNLSIVVDTNNGATTDLGDMFVFYDNPKLFMITFTIGFGAIAMRKTMTFLGSSETFVFAIMTTIYRIHFKLNYNPNDGMLSLEIAETTNNFKDIIVNDIAVIY